MSNFAALIAAIEANIKTNGNEEITGAVLQDVLKAMVQALGTEAINNLETALSNEIGNRQSADGTLQNNIDAEAQRAGTAEGVLQTAINGIKSNIDNGYVYAGIATPSGTPTSGKVFYLAVTAGTYTNFGGLVVTQGINILKYNGMAWSQEQLIALDNTPTPSSSGLVKSGGVFEEIMTNGSAFDLTVHNSGTTYADLSAALTAMDSLPAAYKKGGMSIKFVQTSDNKYVQFRYMSNSTAAADFTNVDNWQGVDDEPTADSDNLVKSGGIDSALKRVEEGFGILHTTFEFGQLSESKGEVLSQFKYRASSASVQGIGRNVVIKTNSGYYIRIVCKYDNNGVYQGYEVFDDKTEYISDGNYNIRFTIAKVSGDQSDISLVENILLESMTYKTQEQKDITELKVKMPIALGEKEIYELSDYSTPMWCQDDQGYITIGRSVSNLYCIFLPINQGDKCIITGEGGIDGRVWYTIGYDGYVKRKADASYTGTDEITIQVDENILIAQTKNSTYNGVIIERSSIKNNAKALMSSKYFGKRISVFGDSISTWGDEDAANELGTYCYSYYPSLSCRYSKLGTVTVDDVERDSIQFDVKDTWWMQVIKNIGGFLGRNNSYRGTSISTSGIAHHSFTDPGRINSLDDRGTPDVILVYGGTNDIGSQLRPDPTTRVPLGEFNYEDPTNYTDSQIAALPTDTFADAVRKMLILLEKTFINSEVIVILPTFTTDYGNMKDLDDFVEVLKEACDYFGIKYIDIRTSGITPFNKDTYLVDGIHPNVQGMTLIANLITEKISE